MVGGSVMAGCICENVGSPVVNEPSVSVFPDVGDRVGIFVTMVEVGGNVA
jgi:hypothetical protein